MKITDVKTETGIKLLRALKQEGWTVLDQYDPSAFDKGVDFDSYTLMMGEERLRFQWTNWLEWDIEGSASLLDEISIRHLQGE